MKSIRYAVVGLGDIAQVAVLPAFKHAKSNSRLTALVTGSEKKGRVLSKKYKVKNVYTYDQYDELLKSGIVDAVYIALPNDQHLDYVCRALDAGIHVLCEKPLAISSSECLKMIAASEKSGAKLMTAYRLHFHKPNLDAIQWCQSGKLGNIKNYVSAFSYVVKDKKNIRLRPGVGSGPLWDIGIYCINAARYLFKENPSEVFGSATRQKEGPFAKVDESIHAILRFSNQRTAVFTCSFNTAAAAYYEVYGDKGKLHLKNAFEYAFPAELRTVIGKKETKKKYKLGDQFATQLTYFSSRILKDKKIEPSGAEGLTDVAIIEAITKSIASGKFVPVHYSGHVHTAKVKPEMIKSLPPVKKPELVDAQNAAGSD